MMYDDYTFLVEYEVYGDGDVVEIDRIRVEPPFENILKVFEDVSIITSIYAIFDDGYEEDVTNSFFFWYKLIEKSDD